MKFNVEKLCHLVYLSLQLVKKFCEEEMPKLQELLQKRAAKHSNWVIQSFHFNTNKRELVMLVERSKHIEWFDIGSQNQF